MVNGKVCVSWGFQKADFAGILVWPCPCWGQG